MYSLQCNLLVAKLSSSIKNELGRKNNLLFISSLDYVSMGCYKDTSNMTILIIEGTDSILDGSYSSRWNPIAKCAVAAMTAGYSMFAVQDGGLCAASATAPQTFDKYGKSTACKADGEGGPSANEVYLIKGEVVKFEQISFFYC